MSLLTRRLFAALAGDDSVPVPDGYSDVVLADSPISYWRLGESSGPTAFDEQGIRNGTLLGNPTLGVAGLLVGDADTAYDFDGSGDAIDIAHIAAYSSASQTIECWVQTPASPPGDSKGLMYKAPDTGFSRAFGLSIKATTGYLEFSVYDGSSNIAQLTNSVNYCDGGIHHLVGVKEYGVSGDTFRLFVDGVEVASSTVAWHGVQNSEKITLGRVTSSSTAGRYFDGKMDEVAIYGGALAADRIAAHYAAGTS